MSSPFLHYLKQPFLRHTSVLALSWWQRMLLVVPVCLLLWWGVMWALGGN
jgi:hypothetical protein